MEFHEFIRNKSVAFVGASPNQVGREMGHIIDNYDVVVRTNGSIDLIDSRDFQKDYGMKIDVLYTNNQFYREMSPLPVSRYKLRGVQWLCMKACKQEDRKRFNEFINCRVPLEAMHKVNAQFVGAAMGAYIYTDILLCQPKEFVLYGVDFFSSKKAVFEDNNYQEYFPGYLPDKIRRQGNIINRGKTEDGHNFKDNAIYIYSLFQQFDNFKAPDYIMNTLKGIVSGGIKQK